MPELIWEHPPVAIFTAPNPGPMTLEGTHTYIVGHDQAYVIDPGPDIPNYQSHLAAWVRAEGIQPRAILLTHGHPDHAPGARTLARDLGVPIVASGSMSAVDRQAFGVSDTLDQGDRQDVDDDVLNVLSTPGHAPDHLAFWLSASRVLFAGDTILGRGTSVIAPPEGNMIAYLQTLRTLRALDPVLIAPGHGPIITDPIGKIDEYIAHREAREAELLAVLRSSHATIPEIVQTVYADVPIELHDLAALSVEAQLVKLESEGRVTVEDGRYRLERR